MITIGSKPSLYRDFAVLSVVILVVMALVSVWITWKTYSAHSEDVVEELQNAAVRIDRGLIIEIEQASYLLESLGRQIAALPELTPEAINRAMESLKETGRAEVMEFYFIDKDQRATVSSGRGIFPEAVDLSDRDHVKRVITSPWQVQTGRPVEGRITGNWVIPLALGMTDQQGHYIGAVGASIPVDMLTRTIREVIDSDVILFAVTTEAFTLMTESERRPGFFVQQFNPARLSEMMMQEDVRRGVYEAPALLGPDDMYTYYESSSRYPYILFLGYEPERSREAVVRLLFPRLLQLAVIAGFLILILWVVRKRIIRPVWILAEHTREIMRTGRFEHDPSDDPSEIVELSNAIRQLARYFEEQKRIETELSLKNRELNKIREAAEITNRVKADFFEQVGTSLMVPANMISEYTESMRNELFGPFGNPKYKEMAEAIHEETHHITEILEDISVISRAESGLLTLNDAPLDVQFVIKKCLRLLRDKPPFQHVEIISDVQDDLPRLAADELRIKQVLLNLLTCAARQIEQEDVIRIFARMRQEQMLIEISYVTSADAGRPEMTTGHAVQPQPRPARSRDHVAGTASLGLGFALSQLIVSMHEGEITVKTMPDRSTRIELVFPAKRVV